MKINTWLAKLHKVLYLSGMIPLHFLIRAGAFALTCRTIQSQELWNPILNPLLKHTWRFVRNNQENSLVYGTFIGKYKTGNSTFVSFACTLHSSEHTEPEQLLIYTNAQ